MSSRLRSLLVGLLVVVTIAASAFALRPETEPDGSRSAAPAASGPGATATPSARPLTATGGRSKPVVAFAGDLYVAGAGASRPGRRGYVALLGTRLGWQTSAAGLRAAGYLDGAPSGTVLDAFAQPDVLDAIERLDLPTLDPDLVVLQAGAEDVTRPSGPLTARVVEAVEAVRRQAPRARIDVVGVLWPTKPPAAAVVVDRAIRAGAEQAGALFTNTIDRRFTASGPDALPDDAGHDVIAVRLASSFVDLGLARP